MLIECEFLRSRNWYSAVFILLNYSNPILQRAKSLSPLSYKEALPGLPPAAAAHKWRRGGGSKQREQPSWTGDAVKISSLSTRLIKAARE